MATHYDAIVIGGSYAGLSAAMQLARARKQVCIVDSGKPRNRFAARSHGFFGFDGAPPAEMIATAFEKVLAYPTVTLVQGRAESAVRDGEGFVIGLEGGARIAGRRLVLAYGVVDQLPAIPGIRERWGATVVHCPYCHGYEFAGKKLGVLAMHPMSIHQGQLIPEWGPTTYFLHEQPMPGAEELALLQKRGVEVERSRVVAIEDDATVVLEDGRKVALAALYIGPRLAFSSDLHEQLGCEVDEWALGKIIRAGERRETSVPGVFAAGDIARMMTNATIASADGVMAGAGAHASLVFPPP